MNIFIFCKNIFNILVRNLDFIALRSMIFFFTSDLYCQDAHHDYLNTPQIEEVSRGRLVVCGIVFIIWQ